MIFRQGLAGFITGFILLFTPLPVFGVTKTVGEMEIIYDAPLFDTSVIWKPGLTETRSFIVKNLATGPRTVGVKAVNAQWSFPVVPSIYVIRFNHAGQLLYGTGNTKTLQEFYGDGEIGLSTLGSGETAQYDIEVTMDRTARNQFQNSRTSFDLNIGLIGTNSEVNVSGLSQNNNSVDVHSVASKTTSTILPVQGEVLGATTDLGANILAFTGGCYIWLLAVVLGFGLNYYFAGKTSYRLMDLMLPASTAFLLFCCDRQIAHIFLPPSVWCERLWGLLPFCCFLPWIRPKLQVQTAGD